MGTIHESLASDSSVVPARSSWMTVSLVPAMIPS